MKIPTLRVAALLTLAVVGSAMFIPSQPAQALDLGRIVQQQTQLIRYEATAYQRKVAEQRARAFVAAQRRTAAPPKTAAKSAEKPKTSATEPGKKSSKVTKQKDSPAPASAEKNREFTPKPLPRYIAVDTVKDKRASPDAKKVVMIFDTQSETLVGNNLYDVVNPPTVGANSRFDTYSAQYIGAGL